MDPRTFIFWRLSLQRQLKEIFNLGPVLKAKDDLGLQRTGPEDQDTKRKRHRRSSLPAFMKLNKLQQAAAQRPQGIGQVLSRAEHTNRTTSVTEAAEEHEGEGEEDREGDSGTTPQLKEEGDGISSVREPLVKKDDGQERSEGLARQQTHVPVKTQLPDSKQLADIKPSPGAVADLKGMKGSQGSMDAGEEMKILAAIKWFILNFKQTDLRDPEWPVELMCIFYIIRSMVQAPWATDAIKIQAKAALSLEPPLSRIYSVLADLNAIFFAVMKDVLPQQAPGVDHSSIPSSVVSTVSLALVSSPGQNPFTAFVDRAIQMIHTLPLPSKQALGQHRPLVEQSVEDISTRDQAYSSLVSVLTKLGQLANENPDQVASKPGSLPHFAPMHSSVHANRAKEKINYLLQLMTTCAPKWPPSHPIYSSIVKTMESGVLLGYSYQLRTIVNLLQDSMGNVAQDPAFLPEQDTESQNDTKKTRPGSESVNALAVRRSSLQQIHDTVTAAEEGIASIPGIWLQVHRERMSMLTSRAAALERVFAKERAKKMADSPDFVKTSMCAGTLSFASYGLIWRLPRDLSFSAEKHARPLTTSGLDVRRGPWSLHSQPIQDGLADDSDVNKNNNQAPPRGRTAPGASRDRSFQQFPGSHILNTFTIPYVEISGYRIRTVDGLSFLHIVAYSTRSSLLFYPLHDVYHQADGEKATKRDIHSLVSKILFSATGLPPFRADEIIIKLLETEVESRRSDALTKLRGETHPWITSVKELESTMRRIVHSSVVSGNWDDTLLDMERLYHSCRLRKEVTKELVTNGLQRLWAEMMRRRNKVKLLAMALRIMDPNVLSPHDSNFVSLIIWFETLEFKDSDQLTKKHPMIEMMLTKLRLAALNIIRIGIKMIPENQIPDEFHLMGQFEVFKDTYQIKSSTTLDLPYSLAPRK
ncbi:hypothetical protein CBR_g31880 [Chara braunii]|uniref:Uncharacterized protein n=1 Tax=Chara braunii TaxID=69332 RepID=A0A388LFX9_CHABU|nr:hypothetical protein CBR_g31880 [Chara braunii]|eukprot:GBG81208.1 hypothetical protein CBR_g31880 [Chara braunii]